MPGAHSTMKKKCSYIRMNMALANSDLKRAKTCLQNHIVVFWVTTPCSFPSVKETLVSTYKSRPQSEKSLPPKPQIFYMFHLTEICFYSGKAAFMLNHMIPDHFVLYQVTLLSCMQYVGSTRTSL